MTSILITGANRGIGFGLVQKILEHTNPPKLLITTCRNPESEGAKALLELTKKHANLRVIKLDVDDIDNYPSVVAEIANIVGDGGLNVLINNAGIKKGTNRDDITWKDYQSMMHTNFIAPVFLTQALLPLIQKAAKSQNHLPLGISKAAIINISSCLGSISTNSTGSYFGYRESKSALNQAARSFAVELKPLGILVCSLHPGWVRTDMGGPQATLDVDGSAKSLVNVIYNLKEEDHDAFYNYDGATIAW